MRNRILAFIIVFIFIFSMTISPAFAAPSNPNHTIIVNGSGFDGSEAVLNFNLIGGSETLSGTISSSNTSTDFSNLDSGTYSLDVTSTTEGYEVDIEPQTIKLVGREKSGTFTVNLSGGVVEDTEPPVINLLGANTYILEGGDDYLEPGYEVSDNVDSPEEISVVVSGEIENFTPGSYTLTYTATDLSGNFSTATRNVEVVDTTAPVITLIGLATVTITEGDTYTDEGATAYDIVDGDVTASIVKTGTVDNTTAGTYYIAYNVSDVAGNSAEEVIRTVIVHEEAIVDTEPPVITLLGDNPINITEGDTFTDPGATAYDTVDGDITANIVKTGEVDTTTAGTYYIAYNVSDAAGNAAEEVTRTIIVEEEVVVETIHYLALGDSIATGTTGISGTMYTYAYQFRDYLSGIYGDNLTYNNLAVDGDDAGELLYRLNNEITYITQVENADIITLSIGGNNIMDAARDDSFWSIDTDIAEEGTSAFESDYPALITRIRSLNPDVVIISMTLYNPYNSANYPTGYSEDEKLFDIGQSYIGRINYNIRSISDSNYKIADVNASFYAYGEIGKMGDITFFYPRYSWWSWWFVKLTRDPHPNQAGQDLIREIYIDAYESQLSFNTIDMKCLA